MDLYEIPREISKLKNRIELLELCHKLLSDELTPLEPFKECQNVDEVLALFTKLMPNLPIKYRLN
ncbi:hypothetical protein [Campylobacter fetus]|uniref:hypothetical protein n=1 Tax=Campylobacter fetus TaxID=196 RepID=UPI000818BC71|nr:hypothetical protein [Campylobacter fetus]OCR92546.1 hypothetical protein CFT12S02263_05215 [Campylobacter fetus subsp. testudinum]